MKWLLSAAVVHGWYQNFIPIDIGLILSAYPEYHVKVFLAGTLSDENPRALDGMAIHLPANFSAEERFPMQVRGEHKKAERWLLDKKHFDGPRYARIGDVDVPVIREDPPPHELETDRAAQIGLPFSNTVRHTRPDQLTGVHSIEIQPYYAAMRDVIAPARERPDEFRPERYMRPQWFSFGYDERLLYEIVKRGIAVLEAHEERPFTDRQPHGRHLGIPRPRRSTGAWRDPKWRQPVLDALNSAPLNSARGLLADTVRAYLDKLEGFLGHE